MVRGILCGLVMLGGAACTLVDPTLTCEVERPTCEAAAATAASHLDIDLAGGDVQVQVSPSAADSCGSGYGTVVADVRITSPDHPRLPIVTIARSSIEQGALEACTY